MFRAPIPSQSDDDEEMQAIVASSETSQKKPTTTVTREPSEESKRFLKYSSLVILVAQTTSLVILLRYTRTTEGDKYLSSTAVAMTEVCKVIACVLIVFVQSGFSILNTLRAIYNETIAKPGEMAKLSVPSLLYTVQNNMLFLALSNLDAVIYQALYQIKILTTALFTVLLLQRSLSKLKWFSLVLLTGGVALVQTANASGGKGEGNAMIGFTAVLSATITSGFAGVYFEKILKGSVTTIWMRNIQMGVTSFVLAIIGVYTQDGDAVHANGFFHGYNNLVWGVIGLSAFGGLTVAVVVKYADNILKAFASGYSILVSLFIDTVFFGFSPNSQVLVGLVVVNLATYLYAKPDQPTNTMN